MVGKSTSIGFKNDNNINSLLTSLYTYTLYITIFSVCAIILRMLGPLLKFGFDYFYLYIYLRVSVCLFAVNAKTTAWMDAKRSGITKNDPESALC